MKHFALLFVLTSFLSSSTPPPATEAMWQDGDIIFQKSQSSQCKAVQAATHSPYSHVGIMFQEFGQWYMLEAVQPVVYTPLKAWIAHGEDNHYVVKRMKPTKALPPAAIVCMRDMGKANLGKHYDLAFEWTDEKMYCSELVWKLYKECAGIEVGNLKKLGDFDLSIPLVAAKVKERYGNNVPLEETVIAPADIFASEDLVTVFSN